MWCLKLKWSSFKVIKVINFYKTDLYFHITFLVFHTIILSSMQQFFLFHTSIFLFYTRVLVFHKTILEYRMREIECCTAGISIIFTSKILYWRRMSNACWSGMCYIYILSLPWQVMLMRIGHICFTKYTLKRAI